MGYDDISTESTVIFIIWKYYLDKDDISTKSFVIFIIDFEIFIHLLYDKLWGRPRRVFTLFIKIFIIIP